MLGVRFVNIHSAINANKRDTAIHHFNNRENKHNRKNKLNCLFASLRISSTSKYLQKLWCRIIILESFGSVDLARPRLDKVGSPD